MKAFSKRILTVICLATLTATEAAMAESSAALILKVGGSISPGPAWENELGQKITEAWFNFQRASSTPDQDVDSGAVKVKLVNAVGGNYPATIALTRPSECKIGSNDVSNSHVQLLQGDEVIAGDSFTIPSSDIQTFKLRFSKDGLYGDKEGNVNCADGVMTYSAT